MDLVTAHLPRAPLPVWPPWKQLLFPAAALGVREMQNLVVTACYALHENATRSLPKDTSLG